MTEIIPRLSEIAAELETLNKKDELPNTIIILLRQIKGHVNSTLVEQIDEDNIFKILSKHPAYKEELGTLLDLVTRYLQYTDLPSAKFSESKGDNDSNGDSIVIIRI